MWSKLFFVILIPIALFYIGELTRRKGFNKLCIYRIINNNRVIEGEEFTIEVVVENNKWLPISFLLIKEKMPLSFQYISGNSFKEGKSLYHISKYSIFNYERRKREYKVKATKRGVYIIKSIDVTIGDIFGFTAENKEILDYKELIVYPKIKKFKEYKFDSTNLLGDNIIKRWVYKDPIYIKGIREYSKEDRMKDIHWKSSLKMNKLMVKEFDYTSEREVVIILNIQCGEVHWSTINEKVIENGIRISASLAIRTIREGIPTGMCTNAKMVSMDSVFHKEVKPSTNSMKEVMELCARIDYSIEREFHIYLRNKSLGFKRNCTYVIVTPYLNSDSLGLISLLNKKGINIKVIDVSKDSIIPSIQGVEKITYKGDVSL